MTRLAYFGTPAMAVPPLEALVAAGHDIALVVTRADKRRGRGSELSPSPVKAAALALGLPVTHQVDDVLALGVEQQAERRRPQAAGVVDQQIDGAQQGRGGARDGIHVFFATDVADQGVRLAARLADGGHDVLKLGLRASD